MSEEQNGEIRTYEPPEEFALQREHKRPINLREGRRGLRGFLEGFAKDLHWFEEWDQVLNWNEPNAEWFVGGKLNVAYNCLDYQVEQGRGDKPAIIWESDEPGDGRTFTYSELKTEVEKFSNVLKGLGVEKGDRGWPST